MPRWQREKSYLTGSRGSSARSDRVMSAAIRQPGLVSSGEPQASADANHVGVERHDQLRRLHARPDAQVDAIDADHPAQEQVEALAGAAGTRAARRSRRRRVWRASSRRPRSGPGSAPASRTIRAPAPPSPRRRPCLRRRSPRSIRPAPASGAAPTAARPDPRRASTGARAETAARRAPRVRSGARTPPGAVPITPSSASIELSTLCTRPNARAAAQNATTSRSAGCRKRRTIQIGSETTCSRSKAV